MEVGDLPLGHCRSTARSWGVRLVDALASLPRDPQPASPGARASPRAHCARLPESGEWGTGAVTILLFPHWAHALFQRGNWPLGRAPLNPQAGKCKAGKRGIPCAHRRRPRSPPGTGLGVRRPLLRAPLIGPGGPRPRTRPAVSALRPPGPSSPEKRRRRAPASLLPPAAAGPARPGPAQGPARTPVPGRSGTARAPQVAPGVARTWKPEPAEGGRHGGKEGRRPRAGAGAGGGAGRAARCSPSPAPPPAPAGPPPGPSSSHGSRASGRNRLRLGPPPASDDPFVGKWFYSEAGSEG